MTMKDECDLAKKVREQIKDWQDAGIPEHEIGGRLVDGAIERTKELLVQFQNARRLANIPAEIFALDELVACYKRILKKMAANALRMRMHVVDNTKE